MDVLMVDVGGTNVKVMARHDGEMRKVPSGKTLTASEMVRAVLEPFVGGFRSLRQCRDVVVANPSRRAVFLGPRYGGPMPK